MLSKYFLANQDELVLLQCQARTQNVGRYTGNHWDPHIELLVLNLQLFKVDNVQVFCKPLSRGKCSNLNKEIFTMFPKIGKITPKMDGENNGKPY